MCSMKVQKETHDNDRGQGKEYEINLTTKRKGNSYHLSCGSLLIRSQISFVF